MIPRIALFALIAVIGSASHAQGQVYQVFYPSTSTVYYQPAVPPATTAYYPAPRTVVYSAPAVSVPVASVAVAPVTYYRPLLGGTVSGWRYVYAPVTYSYPVSTVAYYPAW